MEEIPKESIEKEAHEYESTPLSRPEYISAIVHLYRGEMARATAWRIRLDTTTNWAVLTTAGLLAFAFRTDQNPHWPILIGTLLVSLLLAYEARRYQIFDVWRSRVRKIEENFYGPILRRNPVSPYREWGRIVAEDLLEPSYKLSFRGAVRVRLLRNYWAIYAVLILSWLLKVAMHPRPAHSLADIRENLQSGFIPWWAPFGYVLFLIAIGALIVAFAPRPSTTERFWHETFEPHKGHGRLDV